MWSVGYEEVEAKVFLMGEMDVGMEIFQKRGFWISR